MNYFCVKKFNINYIYRYKLLKLRFFFTPKDLSVIVNQYYKSGYSVNKFC